MLSFLLTLHTVEEKRFMRDLYNEYKGLMLSTAKKYVVDHQAAEDIVQDSLVKLMQKIDVLLPLQCCTLAAYIVSTVRNTAIDHLRARGVEANRISPLSLDDLYMEPSSEERLDEAAIQKENLEKLKAIWPALSETDRFLLERKYLAGDTDLDIAQVLGCKPSSVRMKLTRARRCVINLLQGGVLNERL